MPVLSPLHYNPLPKARPKASSLATEPKFKTQISTISNNKDNCMEESCNGHQPFD